MTETVIVRNVRADGTEFDPSSITLDNTTEAGRQALAIIADVLGQNNA